MLHTIPYYINITIVAVTVDTSLPPSTLKKILFKLNDLIGLAKEEKLPLL